MEQPQLTRAEKLAIWRDSKRNAEKTASASILRLKQEQQQQQSRPTVSAKLSSFVESLNPPSSLISAKSNNSTTALTHNENDLNNNSAQQSGKNTLQEKSKNADNIAGKTSTGAAVLQTKVDAIRLMLNNATGVDRSIYGKLEEIVDEGRHQFEELIALRNRMKSLTTSLRSYRDESHQKEVEIQQLTQTFDRFKVEHERLKSTNRDQNAVIESLHSKLVELTTTTATTTAPAMQISNDELEQLQDELSNLRLTITEKERLIERFAEDYVPLRRFEQVREDNRLLETDLEECYALIEEMKVTIEQHQEVNGANADEELESRLLSLEAHNERLLGEIMRKDDKILELTDALREALDENKQLFEQCMDIQQQSATSSLSVHVEKTDGETQTLAVHLIDANTEPMDDYRKIIEQAHLAMDEYNAMKFANDLMYEQMTENQRRYKVQLDSNKDELKEANNKAEYWKNLLDETIIEIESKSMEILAESVQKYEAVLQQLRLEEQKNAELMKLISS